MGRKDAPADPDEPPDPMRRPIAGRNLAPNRLFRDAEPLGDLRDAEEALPRIRRATVVFDIAFLRRFAGGAIKPRRRRILDRVRGESLAEDAEGFPRRLTRDHANEA